MNFQGMFHVMESNDCIAIQERQYPVFPGKNILIGRHITSCWRYEKTDYHILRKTINQNIPALNYRRAIEFHLVLFEPALWICRPG